MFIPVNGQSELNSLVQKYHSAMRRNSTGFTDIEGSPYYNDKFEDALVFRKGSSGPLNSKMPYNNYFDEMEFLTGDRDEYLLVTEKGKADSILLNGKVYQYLSSFDDKFRDECNLNSDVGVNRETVYPGKQIAEVFPNPVSDKLFIRFNDFPTEKNIKILYTMGQELFEQTSSSDLIEVEGSDFFHKGLLIIEAIVKNKFEYHKILLNWFLYLIEIVK